MNYTPPDTIVVCQHCNNAVYKTKRTLKYGERITPEDVEPIAPQPELNMDEQNCAHCGKEHGFIRLRVPAHLS